MKRRLALGVAASIIVGNQWLSGALVDARDHGGGENKSGGGQPNRGPAGGGEQQAQEQHAREQQVRQQEDDARRNQEQAQRQQQDQMRQQQAQRNQQQQQERQQEQAQRSQQQQERQQEQAQRNQQQQQERQQEQAQRNQQQQQERQQEQAQRGQQEEMRREPESNRQPEQQAQRNQQDQMRRGEEGARGQSNAGMPGNATAMAQESGRFRAAQPRPITGKQMPLNKAVSMPVVDPKWSADEREHANNVAQNLQQHLYPVAEAPSNYSQIASAGLNNYADNYRVNIGNQALMINRQNTYINPFPAYQYPYWYQPRPGWMFSNGFTLGNDIHCALDWLGFGWHPYYGPQPEGFVCATDYMPTPWIYVPAYGLWRVAGENGYASAGPPYDYTGPITVEVLEPRHINVRDPYTGWNNQRIVNVMYLYNAFYDPEAERYGYTNRHGYFIWLNM